MENSNNNYCPELWQRVYISQFNDVFRAKPCCLIAPSPTTEVEISHGTSLFDDYNQSSTIQKLRNDNHNGILDTGCNVCVKHEQAFGHSGRTVAIDRTQGQDHGIMSYVDLNLGNLCNLSCAICGPYASSSWVPLQIKMGMPVSPSLRYQAKNRPVINDPKWFKNIRYLQLQGGEVFLQPAYTEFFENLSQHRDLSEITVTVFTNGTVLPDRLLFQKLSECQHVNLYLSIDDIEARFEYQRRGAKWSEVLKNIQWYLDHCPDTFSVSLSPTASLLNIYYYPDFQEFFSNSFPALKISYNNIYNTSTGQCSAHLLPKRIREVLVNRLSTNPAISHLQGFIAEDDSVDLAPFFDYIQRYDQATGMSYKDVHPEFWKVLNSI